MKKLFRLIISRLCLLFPLSVLIYRNCNGKWEHLGLLLMFALGIAIIDKERGE